MSTNVVLARLATVALFLLPAASVAQDSTKNVTAAPRGTYLLDPSHSQVLFGIVHMGLSTYYGRFAKLSGTLQFDPFQIEKSSVSIEIDMTSVDTPSKRLDGELMGPAVFESGKFPTATFKSTKIEQTGSDTGRITGDLTIKRVTMPVTLNVTFRGGRNHPLSGVYALGFEAKGAIQRTDFGLTGMAWEGFVADEVTLEISAEFHHEEE